MTQSADIRGQGVGVTGSSGALGGALARTYHALVLWITAWLSSRIAKW